MSASPPTPAVSRAAVPGRALRRSDWVVLGVGLLVLALWEASGLDRSMTRWVAGPEGFPWRRTWLMSTLLHQGGRVLSGVLLALVVIDLVRPLVAGPARRARLWAFALTVVPLLVVPGLKRLTRTSCPWDIDEFGGRYAYVPHWMLGVADGGPGHCFPSGHAVAAFAFLGLWFGWRDHRPALARGLLIGVVGFGLLFGLAQYARGAHYLSHTMWSAWCCWAVCMALVAARDALRGRTATPR